MVGVAGFEPATPSSRTRCSTRLSHTPTKRSGLITVPFQTRKRGAQMIAEPATRVVKATADTIASAARCLNDGGLVAFPTETVYGLGGDATNGQAVARLYEAKGRPAFNPLISH